MSTELKGANCRTGSVSLNSFFGGLKDGLCLQLTFKVPKEEEGRPSFGFWYMQLTREQAQDLSQALAEAAAGTREEIH